MKIGGTWIYTYSLQNNFAQVLTYVCAYIYIGGWVFYSFFSEVFVDNNNNIRFVSKSKCF